MSFELPFSDAPTTGEPAPSVEELVGEIAALSESCDTLGDYYGLFAHHVVDALAAVGCVVWMPAAAGGWLPRWQHGRGLALHSDDSETWARQAEFVAWVVATAEAKVVPTGSSAASGRAGPTTLPLVFAPVVCDGQVVAVVEVQQRADGLPAAQRGYVQFLEAVASLAADFHRRQQLGDLRQREQLWTHLERFSRQVHAQLDLDAVGYAIASEAAAVIGCDRVTVVVRRGSKWRVVAVSGVESFNRRANAVRSMETLAQAVARAERPVWCDDADSEQTADDPLLREARGLSEARLIGVLPMVPEATSTSETKPSAVGVLIIEQFDARVARADCEQRAAAIVVHSTLALENALRHRSLPLQPLLEKWARARDAGGRHTGKLVVVAGVLVAAVALMAVVPARLGIEARGQVQPLQRRSVFAAEDGVVRHIYHQHGDQVSAGESLLSLGSAELDFELRRVEGERETVTSRLASLQAARLRDNSGGSSGGTVEQLAAEQEELKQQLAGLQRQHDILTAREAKLTTTSPIDGQLLTWQADELLAERPVRRGQLLMSVADLDGPWVAEIRIAEDRVGHVLAARQQASAPLRVEYILATDPGETFVGKLIDVATATEFDTEQGTYVTATVQIEATSDDGLRPGADVIAEIDCGQRSWGFVWLHRMIATVRRWLWI